MIESPWGPLPWWLVYTPVLLLGLSLGSFANVLIWRLPRGESVATPPSHCPNCNRLIGPLENIPLVSYLWLRGKCRGCGCRISIRYPLIELASGVLALLSIALFGLSYAGFAYGMLFIALLALIIIDLEHWLLPFALTIPLTIIALCGSIWFGLRPVADSLLGMGIGFILFMGMLLGGKALFKRDAMGGGDVVFGIMAGAFLGWKLTILMVFVASLLGTLTALPLLFAGKNVAGRSIPFGPFLAVALVLVLFLGEPIINWYLRFLMG